MARIRDEIERDGPITFARFMELALYDPDGGYYRSEAARPGRDGDFLTAPEAHPIFGAALSRAVADAWDRLGRPDPFVLREYGAGTGTLALAILDGLATERPDLASAIRYEPIEVEPRRLEAIAARLGAAGHGARLTVPASTDRPVDGFFLANEVLDALPTHRVVQRDGRLREVLVGIARGRASSTSRPTHRRPRWHARLAEEGVTLADGQRAEICLAVDALDRRGSGRPRSRRAPAHRLRLPGRGAVRPDPSSRRHAARLPAPSRPRRPVPPRRAAGPDRARRCDRRGARGERGRPRASRHDHPGRVPRRARHGRAAGGHPGRPGDDDGGLPRGPFGTHPPPRPGGDGPVPGHGLRARLAGRGRRWPGWPIGWRVRAPPTTPDRTKPHRTRAMYLLLRGSATRHDSRWSGTT